MISFLGESLFTGILLFTCLIVNMIRLSHNEARPGLVSIFIAIVNLCHILNSYFPCPQESRARSRSGGRGGGAEALACRVCMDAGMDTLFLPCRHVVCCLDCAPRYVPTPSSQSAHYISL